MRREAVCWLLSVVWLAAIARGLWTWERYDTTAGPDRPAAAPLGEPARTHWQLTAFVHPHCPCARATVAELAEIIRLSPELAVRVVFVRPPDTADGWERGGLWDAASRLPDADLSVDDGREARRHGAETSGVVMLTSPDGRRVFSGGLTRARGREGESAGRRAVLDWVSGGSGVADAPVFGCPLFAGDD